MAAQTRKVKAAERDFYSNIIEDISEKKHSKKQFPRLPLQNDAT